MSERITSEVCAQAQISSEQVQQHVALCSIGRYRTNAMRYSENREGVVRMIPFEFTIELPNTELFGNKPKVC